MHFGYGPEYPGGQGGLKQLGNVPIIGRRQKIGFTNLQSGNVPVYPTSPGGRIDYKKRSIFISRKKIDNPPISHFSDVGVDDGSDGVDASSRPCDV